MSNALRHAAGASKVVVEFLEAEDPKCIQVNVTNKGSFIEDSARETIFNKFSSVAHTAGHGGFKNYGLGLTFSKMAVEAMGGRIWITCDKTVPSTTFHFTVKNGGGYRPLHAVYLFCNSLYIGAIAGRNHRIVCFLLYH